MKKMRKTLSFFLAALLCLQLVPGIVPVARASDPITIMLLPDESLVNDGFFEGFGGSMSWWGNRIGHDPELVEQAAEFFYSPDGLNLDIARFEIKGGDNPNCSANPAPGVTHMRRDASLVPWWEEFNPTTGKVTKYIWEGRTPEEVIEMNPLLKMALAAVKATPNLVFFAGPNSPPYFMTASGCSAGNSNMWADNVAADRAQVYAEYAATVVDYLITVHQLPIISLAMMNEPNGGWTRGGAQEGARVRDTNTRNALIINARAELDKFNLQSIVVSGQDLSQPWDAPVMHDELSSAAKNAMDRIDVHTYDVGDAGRHRSAANRSGSISTYNAAVRDGLNLWQTETDAIYADFFANNADGLAAGFMATGIDLASKIIFDMNGLRPSGWVLWDIIGAFEDDVPDPKYGHLGDTVDGLGWNTVFDPTWGRLWAANDTENPWDSFPNDMWGYWGIAPTYTGGEKGPAQILRTQKYYAFGQFSRYIKPGDAVIMTSDTSDRTLAAYTKAPGLNQGDIKIVGVNNTQQQMEVTYDMSAFNATGSQAIPYRTSNGGVSGTEPGAAMHPAVDEDGTSRGGEQWAQLAPVNVVNRQLTVMLLPNSVTTFVIENNTGDEVGLFAINGPDSVLAGETGSYTAMGLPGIEWSVSDTFIAEIGETTGVLTPKNTGLVTVVARLDTLRATKTVRVISARKLDIPTTNITQLDLGGWGELPAHILNDDLNSIFYGWTHKDNAPIEIDLGEAYNLAMIQWAPRTTASDHIESMVGVIFAGSPNGTDWEEIYYISKIPTSGFTNTAFFDQLSDTGPFRYIRIYRDGIYHPTDPTTGWADFHMAGIRIWVLAPPEVKDPINPGPSAGTTDQYPLVLTANPAGPLTYSPGLTFQIEAEQNVSAPQEVLTATVSYSQSAG